MLIQSIRPARENFFRTARIGARLLNHFGKDTITGLSSNQQFRRSPEWLWKRAVTLGVFNRRAFYGLAQGIFKAD